MSGPAGAHGHGGDHGAGPDHNAAHDGAHAHGHDAAHGTRRSYLIGFALSVVLTAIPFWLVMSGGLAPQPTALLVVGLAMVQIVVHTIFFLHVTSEAENGWMLMTLAFTTVMIVIVVSGSLWIMYHLNSNLMPMTQGTMPGM